MFHVCCKDSTVIITALMPLKHFTSQAILNQRYAWQYCWCPHSELILSSLSSPKKRIVGEPGHSTTLSQINMAEKWFQHSLASQHAPHKWCQKGDGLSSKQVKIYDAHKVTADRFHEEKDCTHGGQCKRFFWTAPSTTSLAPTALPHIQWAAPATSSPAPFSSQQWTWNMKKSSPQDLTSSNRPATECAKSRLWQKFSDLEWWDEWCVCGAFQHVARERPAMFVKETHRSARHCVCFFHESSRHSCRKCTGQLVQFL